MQCSKADSFFASFLTSVWPLVVLFRLFLSLFDLLVKLTILIFGPMLFAPLGTIMALFLPRLFPFSSLVKPPEEATPITILLADTITGSTEGMGLPSLEENISNIKQTAVRFITKHKY